MAHMTYRTSDFEFNKEGRYLIAELSTLGFVPGESFPDSLEVRSEKTGKLVVFRRDNTAAIRNEFWDGELMEYRPEQMLPNCVRLVLLND